MPSVIRQAGVIAWISLRSLSSTPLLTFSMIFAVALVTVVLLAFLSLSQGFRGAFARSGNDDIAIVLRGGSQSELNSVVTREQFNLVASALTAPPSGEVNLVVDGHRAADGSKTNISFRGLSSEGIALRQGFRMVSGRLFAPGSDEIIVGRAAARNYRHLNAGSITSFGPTRWTVVGIFEAAGGLAETEIWADAISTQGQFNRPSGYQSIRIKLGSPSSIAEVRALMEHEPRLRLAVKTEREYFSQQAAMTTELIHRLGWPLAILLSFGAFAGAINTMTAAVSLRIAEIATARALGFSRVATFLGALAESCLIAVAGGAIGVAFAYATFSGLRTSLGSGITEVAFSLEFTRALIIQAMTLALMTGAVGGLLPAWSAARKPIAQGLRG